MKLILFLIFLSAMTLHAQSALGGFSDAMGFGAMGGTIVLLLAWVRSLRRKLRRAPAVAAATESSGEDEHEVLSTLLEHATDQIYFKDCQSRIQRCSDAMCKRFNLTEGTIRGKTDFDFFDVVHAQQAFADEREIVRTGVASAGKAEREVLKDGTEKWALTAKMPWRDRYGKIIGTFGISKDITEFKRTEAELAYERDLLTTLLDNTLDTIYFKDLESRFVRVSGSKVECALALARAKHKISWPEQEAPNLPAHLTGPQAFASFLLGKTDFDFHSEEDARASLRDEQEIIRTGESIANKLEKVRSADGQVRWVVTTKGPWRRPDGTIIGTFGISKDVTFIKEAEQKLEVVHKQLMQTSRQAGMAEVATTVLHNVGNVLNSVNISASMVAEKVKNSKTGNLVRAADLLRDHSSDLANFLTHDRQGASLPAYIIGVAKTLVSEQNEMLGEISSLCANVEHIKEIVAMQQSYARVSGLQETLKPTDLIEDALRLNAGAFERHHVKVTREYTETPAITVDKHKVLQILVNLVHNAKYAVEERPPGNRQMILQAEPGSNGSVKISVIDNGVGIAPENIHRIFEHGFTTRQNGHGFGLHSGALAAREMGGSLTCVSAGKGCGAVFILELPLQPPDTHHEG